MKRVQSLLMRGRFFRLWQSFIVLIAFVLNYLGPVPIASAESIYSLEGGIHLPAPGILVYSSPDFTPPILKGIKIHPENPLRFDFILDKGDAKATQPNRLYDNQEMRTESTKLIKYFLASLTIPEQDLWVNLSPYERNRIIPNSFGQTEMGRDLLAEDYMLKQITASLIYPEGRIGRLFWKRIYQEAFKRYGSTNIPINTFNKVWIVPDKAVVYENVKAGTAYVVEARLKVMLEQDYLSLERHNKELSSPNVLVGDLGHTKNKFPAEDFRNDNKSVSLLGSQIVREIVIPELTKEVNQGENFAQLRQVYNSLILAIWYKRKIRDSILEHIYEDKNKVVGIGYKGYSSEYIYQRYLQAFKKGVYNYIKEESDFTIDQDVSRKYFSGGVGLRWGIDGEKISFVDSSTNNPLIDALINSQRSKSLVEIDSAMNVKSMATLMVAIISLLVPSKIAKELHVLKPVQHVIQHKVTPIQHAPGELIRLGSRRLEKFILPASDVVGVIGKYIKVKGSNNVYLEYHEIDSGTLPIVCIRNEGKYPQQITLQGGQSVSAITDNKILKAAAQSWLGFQNNQRITLYVLDAKGGITQSSTRWPITIPSHGILAIPNGPYVKFNGRIIVIGAYAITSIKESAGKVDLKLAEMAINIHHFNDIKKDLSKLLTGVIKEVRPLRGERNLRDDYDIVSPKSTIVKPFIYKDSPKTFWILSKTDRSKGDDNSKESTYEKRVYFKLVNDSNVTKKFLIKLDPRGGPAVVYVFNNQKIYYLDDQPSNILDMVLPPKGKGGFSIVFLDGGNFPVKMKIVGTIIKKSNVKRKQGLGGIDLSSANINLKTQNRNGEIEFHIDPVVFEELKNSSGFVPVIIGIKPLADFKVFLGINTQ